MFRCISPILFTVLSTLAVPGFSTRTSATQPDVTTLDVGGEQVRIVRDDFGVPHIFAETNRALFEAYGYTVAQDRLWQLELFRRAARGRLAEIFGSRALPADEFVRTVGYTDAELDAQFARLTAEERAIFEAYADGINRYVREVIAPDPLHKLPLEFIALLIGFPAPWIPRDSVAVGAFMTRAFGEIGGRELINQSLLHSLIASHGPAAGVAIFNDVRWINDPDAPVTVPVEGAMGRRPRAPAPRPVRPAQLRGATTRDWPDPLNKKAREIWEALGIPTKLGSYAWVVNEARSTSGFAMLYGGPQMGFNVPEILHEVQLTGGSGFHVTGMAFAGIPIVLIGRNDHIAWTSTTGAGDNVDTYIETLCGAGTSPNAGYVFQGGCRAFETRQEIIRVRGSSPVSLTVLRSVHGPVMASGPGVVFTMKRAHWQREINSVRPFLAFDRAHHIQEFAAAVRQIVTSHNLLYADKLGNIAYWQAGQVPLRPPGFDPRLPLPGDGSAEWPGGVLPMPVSINPAQGFLANWNNKPSVDYDNADAQIFGKQFRLLDIVDRLAAGPVSLEDMRDIPKDIARVKALGREARFLKPYLLDALNAVPPTHPLGGQARTIVQGWDGSAIADAIASTQFEAGETIFSAWLGQMLINTFGDELGAKVTEADPNMLLHVLDHALGSGSGVPPSHDYFNGTKPRIAISAAFDDALADLVEAHGNNPALWTPPRGTTDFIHPVVGRIASIPLSNRATYAQIVVLGRPRITSENIFTLGQSGFIGLSLSGLVFDPHFKDQLELFRNFRYKPMRLLRNVHVRE